MGQASLHYWHPSHLIRHVPGPLCQLSQCNTHHPLRHEKNKSKRPHSLNYLQVFLKSTFLHSQIIRQFNKLLLISLQYLPELEPLHTEMAGHLASFHLQPSPRPLQQLCKFRPLFWEYGGGFYGGVVSVGTFGAVFSY